MRDITRVSRHALEEIVRQTIDRLYLDINPPGCPRERRDHELYNPDKDWDIDDLAFIAELLRAEDLAPEFVGDEPDEA
jgi:hypothetical protein